MVAEVIVDGKEGGVVEVRRHDIRVRDVGPDVLIREPEHGAGGESEIAVDGQQRADGEDLHVEERVVLVEIPRLFDVIRADLLGGDVALVDDKRRLFAPLTGHFLVIDVEAVEELLEVDQVLVVEHFVTVQVFVHLQLPFAQELEDEGEEVHLVVHRADGIIERGVLLFHQVDLTVDDAHPAGVADLLRHAFVEFLGADGEFRQTVILFFFRAFASAGTWAFALLLGCLRSGIFFLRLGRKDHHPRKEAGNYVI